MAMAKKHWIEGLMDAERGPSRVALLTTGCILATVVLIFGYLALSPFLDGVYTLDTSEKVKRFSQDSYMDGVLPYSASLDTMRSITITSTTGDQLSSLQGTSERDTIYNVYRLAGGGFSVIYLTEGLLQDTGSVHVQATNRELNDEIIREITPNGSNIYVLYDAGSPVSFLTMLAALTLVMAASFGFAYSNALRRRTGLGRQIAKEGDFRETCREINHEAANPLFMCFGAAILKSWVVLRGYDARTNRPSDFIFAPARDVTGLDVALDADRDEMFACRFDIAGRPDPFTLYLDRERAERLKVAVREMAGREMAL
jgi:hypothetical protein